MAYVFTFCFIYFFSLSLSKKCDGKLYLISQSGNNLLNLLKQCAFEKKMNFM